MLAAGCLQRLQSSQYFTHTIYSDKIYFIEYKIYSIKYAFPIKMLVLFELLVWCWYLYCIVGAVGPGVGVGVGVSVLVARRAWQGWL